MLIDLICILLLLLSGYVQGLKICFLNRNDSDVVAMKGVTQAVVLSIFILFTTGQLTRITAEQMPANNHAYRLLHFIILISAVIFTVAFLVLANDRSWKPGKKNFKLLFPTFSIGIIIFPLVLYLNPDSFNSGFIKENLSLEHKDIWYTLIFLLTMLLSIWISKSNRDLFRQKLIYKVGSILSRINSCLMISLLAYEIGLSFYILSRNP